jgi:hypothetical protein
MTEGELWVWLSVLPLTWIRAAVVCGVVHRNSFELSSQGPRWSTHCAVVVKGLGGQGQARKDARFLHRNGSMSSGVHEEIGVLFSKADILTLGASTSHWICPQKMCIWSSTGSKSNSWNPGQRFVWWFAWASGQILICLSIPTVGSWWSQWVVMAACCCYSWWRWWLLTLLWATRIDYTHSHVTFKLLWRFLHNFKDICWY